MKALSYANLGHAGLVPGCGSVEITAAGHPTALPGILAGHQHLHVSDSAVDGSLIRFGLPSVIVASSRPHQNVVLKADPSYGTVFRSWAGGPWANQR